MDSEEEMLVDMASGSQAEQSIIAVETAYRQAISSIHRKIEVQKHRKDMMAHELELKHKLLDEAESEIDKIEEKSKEMSQFCDQAELNHVNYRNSNAVLKDHHEELRARVQKERSYNERKRREFAAEVASYRRELQDRLVRYQDHPFYPEYLSIKQKLEEQERYLTNVESEQRQNEKQLFKLKCERAQRMREEKGYYPLENFVLLLAQFKTKSNLIMSKYSELAKDMDTLESNLAIKKEYQKMMRLKIEARNREAHSAMEISFDPTELGSQTAAPVNTNVSMEPEASSEMVEPPVGTRDVRSDTNAHKCFDNLATPDVLKPPIPASEKPPSWTETSVSGTETPSIKNTVSFPRFPAISINCGSLLYRGKGNAQPRPKKSMTVPKKPVTVEVKRFPSVDRTLVPTKLKAPMFPLISKPKTVATVPAFSKISTTVKSSYFETARAPPRPEELPEGSATGRAGASTSQSWVAPVVFTKNVPRASEATTSECANLESPAPGDVTRDGELSRQDSEGMATAGEIQTSTEDPASILVQGSSTKNVVPPYSTAEISITAEPSTSFAVSADAVYAPKVKEVPKATAAQSRQGDGKEQLDVTCAMKEISLAERRPSPVPLEKQQFSSYLLKNAVLSTCEMPSEDSQPYYTPRSTQNPASQSSDESGKASITSPLDYEKHLQTLKDMMKSPVYQFPSRKMFDPTGDGTTSSPQGGLVSIKDVLEREKGAGLGDGIKAPHSPPTSKASSAERGLDVASIFNSEPEDEPLSPPRPKPGSEKPMFSFHKSSSSSKKTSLFDVFGCADQDDDGDNGGDGASSQFTLDFGGPSTASKDDKSKGGKATPFFRLF